MEKAYPAFNPDLEPTVQQRILVIIELRDYEANVFSKEVVSNVGGGKPRGQILR